MHTMMQILLVWDKKKEYETPGTVSWILNKQELAREQKKEQTVSWYEAAV